MDKKKSTGKPEEQKQATPGNLSDRLVAINSGGSPPKPQPWPPTLEEYSKAIDPRTSLF